MYLSVSGDPRHPPDLPGDAVAKVAMNRVTGAFADPSLESACAAQLFRMAFPCHAFLMALTLAILIWTSLSVPADLLPFVSIVTFITTLSLVSRVLIHRIHDTVRGQRLGSWTWTAQSVLRCVAIALGGYVVATATGCENLQSHQVAPFAGLTAALLNGSYGLGFWHKLGLIGLMLLDGLCASALCGEVALAGESMIVVGFVVAHMVEMHLRHSYAEVQLLKEDQQEKRGLAERNEQLDERNEQLQTSNERLLYDVQRRGRPLDDDDDRSAIRRGLQAGPSQPCPPTSDTDPSEPGGVPSSDSPPTLPPGPPSSASSGSVASLGQKVVPARLVVPATWAGSNLSGAPNYSGVEPTAAAPTAAPTVEPSPLLRHASFSAPPKRPDQSTWLRGFAASAAALARARWTRSPEEGKGHAPSATARASSGEQEQLAAEALADLATAEGATMAQPFVSTTWRARSSRNLTGFSEGVRSSEGGSNAELQKEAKQLRQIGGSTSPKASLKREGHTEEDRRTTVTIASSSMTSEMKVPHQHRAVSGGVSTCSTVEDKFYMHVCNYTPRAPGELPMKHWVSCAQMLRELQPHAPEEDYVNQLITNHFKNHPTFAGHPFCAWCKKLKDYDAPARGTSKKNVMKFSLEYTPASVRVSK